MFGGWMPPFSIFIALLLLMLSVEAPNDDFVVYVKNPFDKDHKDMLTDVLEGTGLGATYGSAGGGWGVLIVGYGGLLYGVAKHDFTYEDCVAMLRACSQKWATCVLAKKDRNHEDICCGTGYVFTCYNDWKNDKLENEERMIKQTGDIADVMRSKTHCEPEKYCGSCGNKYSCVETSMTYDGTACCEKGTTMECCVTTTTTTTTPTTTTTTRATTTTTDENLRCKKAFYESHPTEGDKYTEKLNQACGRNDQYCYVFNCTTVLPSIEGYIGFRAEWGCSASKTAFEDNFKKGKGHANSTCVSFVGSKYSDNSNHDKNALLPSSNVSTLWCEGGHFWKKRHHGKTITVCSKHEHYCYVLNCTLELRGKADSFQPKHYVLTQWGCTDKKPAELILDTKLIAKTAAGRILTQTCSRYVGKANVSRTNAGITVPTPAKECKKAYRSKLRAYNESSDQLCGQSQRYCYVLNCSTAVEGGNQPEIMTEWGCTNSLYKTADFREGKGRQLDEAYSVGPIPNNSVCRSSVGIFSNVGIMLPLLISTSNSSNSTLKCKRSRITSGGITDDHEECAAGDIVCYAVSCSNGTHSNNDVKEWGCTSDVAELCQQKAVQFDFEFKSCKCFYGTSDQLLTHNSAMKMKSAADLGEGSSSAINHHIDKRSLNPSSSAVSMTRSINHCQFVLVALLTSCAYLFRNVYSIV